MKLYKLVTHTKNYCCEDLILNSKDNPDAKVGDIVEIYHQEDEGCRLLLQISHFNDELIKERNISVESSIAASFNLRTYADVIMQVIDPTDVALDSVELTFKDQYMGRSEMWRLKMYLTNTCVYVNKQIKYCKDSIRCQVYEMWAKGDRVACGVITENTKVVFRSSTSMVYLFIQMSSEMWDFDIHGDLYFEKAVNGFMTDLFAKWKKLGSNPEVTIVLFSRTFYAARSLDEFPSYMRQCLQEDYRGRYYEDFYRVAIQNERNDDWATTLVQLRRLFTAYQSIVLHYHDRPDEYIPPATNSTAAQGNFLEVLNISLNVFEKHYLDRSFDRTGQLSVVITPGVGVFEVDRELTNITKQRIIDNGVGSDLVCVGEQPLHAVPLLKFHNKDIVLSAADDYSMPHWINLSFYSTNKKVAYSSFIPRIKLPPLNQNRTCDDEKDDFNIFFNIDNQQTEYIHNSLFDYDAYDAQIFTLPPAHGTCSLQRAPRAKKTSVPNLEAFGTMKQLEWDKNEATNLIAKRKMSDPDIYHGNMNYLSRLSPSVSPKFCDSIINEKTDQLTTMYQVTPIIRPGRALINPFDPSHVTIKLTSYRRRWTHIFPKGPSGVLIQQHHYQAVPTDMQENNSSCNLQYDSMSSSMSQNYGGLIHETKRKSSTLHSPAGPLVSVKPSKSITLLWGATGEQEWTPALTTGVDWKSLTIPACLPITTDYFPDDRSLKKDYVVSLYTLLPEDVNAEYSQRRAVCKKPLTTEEVFKELISQRLAQGFQLIVSPDNKLLGTGQSTASLNSANKRNSVLLQSSQKYSNVKMTEKNEYILSIGRLFHKISLNDSQITVTTYRPRHPYSPLTIGYQYRFQAPQHDTYEVSGVTFTTEKLENFAWNHMDQYICSRGDTDYPLLENLKYWRYRMYLLPKEHAATKKIIDGTSAHCDIYTEIGGESEKQQIDDFMRFIERLVDMYKPNKIQCNKKQKESPTAQQSHLTKRRHSTSILSRPPPNQALGNSPFRERLGSNRVLPTRPRSGSKALERCPQRMPSAVESSGSSVTIDTTSINSDEYDEAFVTEMKLNSNATVQEIFEAMKHPVNGLNFLMKSQSLPSLTFVAYDAVQWIQNRVDGIINAVELLETIRMQRLICHASGDFSRPFVYGFVLFYIVHQDTTSTDYSPPIGSYNIFENEWLEVEVKYPDIGGDQSVGDEHKDESDVPKFLREQIIVPLPEGPIYKHTHLEIDFAKKSDRTEWGHVKYHRTMMPGYAWEIVVQWVAASGPIVYDLIINWIRKANVCNFQLIPIPADTLNKACGEHGDRFNGRSGNTIVSTLDKSDPLRGPIFIPLNVKCLNPVDSSNPQQPNLFEEFDKESWPSRLFLLQDAIVTRFGFVKCYAETKIGSNSKLDQQYVHCSGNMFIMIQSPNNSSQIRQRLASNDPLNKPIFRHNGKHKASDDNYVTRHVNINNIKDELDVPQKIGFLMSWNHMIPNKKWKSFIVNNSSDGELFQLKMLRDFRLFCSNHDDRLLNFWEHCWEAKEKSCTK